MNELFLMVGLPRSGKTTLARTKGLPIVSPDELRKIVLGRRFDADQEGLIWWVTRIMVKALFAAGCPKVILDATSVTTARRTYWKNEGWVSRYVVIDTPAEECVKRANQLSDDYILPVIDRMVKEWEPLTKEEAFDAVDPHGDW